MSVVGSYTPATNWNIETVFTPDADMDQNSHRGALLWEFQNGNYYHALYFTAFKWQWIEERFVGGNWVRYAFEADLDGIDEFGYYFYKDNLVPITIQAIYDYTNQRRKIFVNGYLLATSYTNIPAINQSLQLTIYTGATYDRFYGTIGTITYTATAPSPTPLVPASDAIISSFCIIPLLLPRVIIHLVMSIA